MHLFSPVGNGEVQSHSVVKVDLDVPVRVVEAHPIKRSYELDVRDLLVPVVVRIGYVQPQLVVVRIQALVARRV